jgi:flagellar secretion chaperone FliS
MASASNEYLRNAILTASPEQLHLMLYDGAIRFTREGIQGIEDKDWEQAFNGFSRSQKIILEMLGSLNYDVDRSLCTRMAGLYNYIYRHLVTACADRSAAAGREALRFLEYQRETWVMLLAELRDEHGAAPRTGPTESGDESSLQPACTLSVEG